MGEIRKFETGATRDTDQGKLDYEGFISPLVLRAYSKYLYKHRIQSDGQLRSADNWQKLFGEQHNAVCMKSLIRHMVSLWLIHDGYTPEDSATIEDTLSAIIFNASAYLYKIEKDKEDSKVKPTS